MGPVSDGVPQPPGSWFRVTWAVLLSLFQPGLGHLYSGAWRLGAVLWLLAVIVGAIVTAASWRLAPTPVVIGVFVVVCLVIYLPIAIDAARRVRRTYDKTRAPWYRSTWMAAIMMVGISVGLSYIPGNTFGWRSFYIASQSTLPTLQINERIFVFLYRPGDEPARGDIIVYVNPKPPHADFIKRVVGLPGDVVEMKQGTLYLNGKPIPRQQTGTLVLPHTQGPPLKTYRETMPNGHAYAIAKISDTSPGDNTAAVAVPADHYYVLGDNRDNSLDSRQQGVVPKANLVGIARAIYWSNDFGRILSRVD